MDGAVLIASYLASGGNDILAQIAP